MIYNFADITWQITPKNSYVQKMLLPFLAEGEPQVILPEYDGNTEKELADMLYDVNSELVNRFDGLMVHGAAIVYKNRAYLFTAPSGTGKTTHVRLWEKYVGDKAYILNGDKPFLRVENGTVTVYSGPWMGKEQLGRNDSAELGGIYILKRAPENSVSPATPADVIRGLMEAVLFESDSITKAKTLSLLSQICKTVPTAVLYCNKQETAVQTVIEHIEKGSF